MKFWILIIPSLIAFTAAVTVAITTSVLNGRNARREHASDLVDERRVEAYTDLLRWIIEAIEGLKSIPFHERQRRPDVIKPLLATSDLESRVMATGTPSVRATYGMVRMTLSDLAAGRSAPAPADGFEESYKIFMRDYEAYLDRLASLDSSLAALSQEIQHELDLAGGGAHNSAVRKDAYRNVKRR